MDLVSGIAKHRTGNGADISLVPCQQYLHCYSCLGE
jgi:hypothetical protein